VKILPKKEFTELASEVGFTSPEEVRGFISLEGEPVIPEGMTTRVRTHEVGHQVLKHVPKNLKYYSKRRRKDPSKVIQPEVQVIDDEIEAEIYSYKVMGKRITPRVGIQALWNLLAEGYPLYPALSLVIGRLRKYKIPVSLRKVKKV